MAGFKLQNRDGTMRDVSWLPVMGGFVGAISTIFFGMYLLVSRSFDKFGLIGFGISLALWIPCMVILFRE